jgi:3-oxoacyl-[acyl-carrier-protein] synthase II
MRDGKGRPLVAVTGMGVVTSLGQGKADNWAALTAGRSGIHAIGRFPTEGLRTRIAGTIDFVPAEPSVAPVLSERLAALAAAEAVDEAGIGRPADFPGGLFIAVPPVEMEWPQRQALAAASGTNDAVTYADLLRAAGTGRFRDWHELFIFGTVADRIADRFGTEGSPISLSTACSSARPRSSSASRRSAGARWRPRSASAPTAP